MKNPLIYFTKYMGDCAIEQMVQMGRQFGCDGFDLACRKGQTVTPENVTTMLPRLVKQLAAAGLGVPMVTVNATDSSEPGVEAILGAMRDSGIKLLKMGYFPIDAKTDDYWEKVSIARKQIEGWVELGRRHDVRICYHTHSSGTLLGLNASSVMHLLRGFDPRWVGVYLDPAHLLLDGEHPDIAFNIVKGYLAIVALKDACKQRSNINAGYEYVYCRAGHGDVDWGNLFENIKRAGFDGPLSVHAQYERYMESVARGDKSVYFASLHDEIEFFRRYRDGRQPVETRI